MKRLFVFLLLSMLANAALEQTYVQTVGRDGSSVIEKKMDVSLFVNQLPEGALERMTDICLTTSAIKCSVNNTTITIIERLPAQNGYYTFTTEYGVPFITYTLTVRKLPTDRFASDLDMLLAAAGATEGSSGAAAVDLNANNNETAYYLKLLKTDVSYAVEMPTGVERGGTPRGEVSGSLVNFDLVQVLEEGGPMVVRSQELNFGYLVIICAAIVLGALTLSFFYSVKRRKKD